MTKHLLRISMLATLMVSLSQAETYYVDVPFNFVIGNKTLQAGQYIVDPSYSTGVTSIRSSDHSINFLLMGPAVTALDHTTTGKLVFHAYGGRYFLSEVWSRGSNAGRQLPRTPEERELAAHRDIPKTRTTIALR